MNLLAESLDLHSVVVSSAFGRKIAVSDNRVPNFLELLNNQGALVIVLVIVTTG